MTVDSPLFVTLAGGLALFGRLLPAAWASRLYAVASLVVFLGLQPSALALAAGLAFVALPFLGVRLLGHARAPGLLWVQVAAAVGLRALAGPREHRLGHVDPEDAPRGADALGDRQRGVAAATADVEHAQARREVQRR